MLPGYHRPLGREFDSWGRDSTTDSQLSKCQIPAGVFLEMSRCWRYTCDGLMANHFCASPTGVFLTVRYHYGRERAKTCQYIHLVGCIAMSVNLRLRGESRSGKGGPDFCQCLSAYIMQIKGIPQWRHGNCELEVSERLLTFPCSNVVLSKCGQSECHGPIQLTSVTWLECPTWCS